MGFSVDVHNMNKVREMEVSKNWNMKLGKRIFVFTFTF